MTQRTCNIIMACKSCSDESTDTQLDKVKQYMSKECDCPIEHYTQGIMDDIMFEAMCDYIDTCDRPSFFLRELKNVKKWVDKSIAEIIAIAFDLIQIKEIDENIGEIKYINGFTEELLYKAMPKHLLSLDNEHFTEVIR